MHALGLVVILAAGALLAWGMVVCIVAWQLTHPPRRGSTWALAKNRPGTPAELAPPLGPRAFEPLVYSSTHGRGEFPAWRIAGDLSGGPLMLFAHGWGDSRVTSLARIAHLARHARAVVAWDIPMHGDRAAPLRAGDPPRMLTMGVAEVDDLCDIARALHDESPEVPLILAGFSLGAGLSIAAAARPDVAPLIAGVIAEAPYTLPATPAANVMRLRSLPAGITIDAALLLAGMLARNPRGWRGVGGAFDRARSAARLTCPLLLIHSRRDEICPIADAEDIAAAAGLNATLVTLGTPRHLNLWESDDATDVHSAIAAWMLRLRPVEAGSRQLTALP
ncbi:hypothetical protein BH11PLA1_BH11PLA1_14050 [soil metagenome]